MSDVLRVLTEARELISDQRRWTQGDIAKNAAGARTSPYDKEAVCWCAYGAIDRSSRISLVDIAAKFAAERSIQNSAETLFSSGIVHVNDDLGHAAVLRMFDAAIAAEQAKLASPSP